MPANIIIIQPNITEEERQRRLKATEEVIRRIARSYLQRQRVAETQEE